MRVATRRSAAIIAVAAASLIPTVPAMADTEVTQRPESGSLTTTGRGYGHGRGMSQWGAYGAASRHGLHWRQILDFYYPGTARTTISDNSIKVWISADKDGNTTVVPTKGLAVSWAGGSRTLPTGSGYRAWRVVKASPMALQYQDAKGKWRGYDLGRSVGSEVRFSTGLLNSRPRAARALNATVRILLPNGRQQEVRGIVHSTRSGNTVYTMVHSTMESYLRSVVPREMPASWHTHALSAQSVAARTYAAAYRDRQRARGAVWDICDTVSCQVFGGVASYSASGRHRTGNEHARTDAAIAATAGVVLRSSARKGAGLANTEFSASNGGYTVASGASYIVAKPDPYDGAITNASNSWRTTISVSTLERVYGLGTFKEVRILSRDGRGPLGGRVRELALVGTDKTVNLTGMQLRTALKLKSDWFAFS